MMNDLKHYMLMEDPKELLRSSGLRPTKQRLTICKVLFDRKETFHFTIDKLKKKLKKIPKVRFLWQLSTTLCMLLEIMVI